MSLPQIFSFEQHEVRTLERDGDIWFVAKDVAEVLGYARPKDAVSAHCKGAVKHRLPSASGDQDYTIIPERDVYRLVMRSKLPSAEKFENWVVSEVLPSIRKTGTYNHSPLSPELQLAHAMLIAGNMIEEQKQLIQLLTPKANALDRLTLAEGSMCITNAAKALQVQPKHLFHWMYSRKWIYRRPGAKGWVAFQDKIRTGYLIHKIVTIALSDGSEKIVENVLMTPKGLAAIAQSAWVRNEQLSLSQVMEAA